MIDFAAHFQNGLSYQNFLAKFGTDEHRRRWSALHDAIKLTDAQRELLGGFRRKMRVLCLAGTWCGDCVNQCPIFDHFAQAAATIDLRFQDRDADAELAETLKICGGGRVPVVVFLNEDGQFVSLLGDRTLSKYRQLADDQLGSSIVPDWVGRARRFAHRSRGARVARRIRARATLDAALDPDATTAWRLIPYRCAS